MNIWKSGGFLLNMDHIQPKTFEEAQTISEAVHYIVAFDAAFKLDELNMDSHYVTVNYQPLRVVTDTAMTERSPIAGDLIAALNQHIRDYVYEVISFFHNSRKATKSLSTEQKEILNISVSFLGYNKLVLLHEVWHA